MKILNKFKSNEKEVETLKELNSQLKDEVTQLIWYKEEYECAFTHGEEKFERLFRLGKAHRDKTGIGYIKQAKNNANASTIFVKEKGSSRTHNTSEITCHFLWKQRPL